MRKIIFSVLLLSTFLLTGAQNKTKDYFVGKWSVLTTGTPGGDSKMMIHIVRTDGKLTGIIYRTGEEPTETSKIEEAGNTATIYFKHKLFTVKIALQKKDAIHAEGSMLDNFPVNAVRIK